MQITVPDEIYQRVERLARLTGREVAEVASIVLQASLCSLDINALELNDPIAVMVRLGWVNAGWYPPKE